MAIEAVKLIATKVAGKLVTSIISLKIKQIKSWMEEKEINHLVSNDMKIEELLKNYTSRLLKQCTEISTLVFSQEKIPLESIYEPLSLKSESNIGKNTNKNVNIDYESENKTYVITDEAGMGKSTFSKNLSIKIILETNKLPIFFEFSEYQPDLSLIDNLLKKLDDIDKLFDKRLFTKLIASGKFFIILDGFDEIPRNAQKQITKEIATLNSTKGKSSLLLTSRPHEKLPILAKSEKLSLKKLSLEQAKFILKKLDSLSKREIGKNLISEINNIPEKFLETPLLVGLLYRTYSFNKSIAKKTSVFYPEIYEALYKGHDLTKDGFEREKISNLEIDNFRKLLAALCYLYIADTTGKNHSLEYFIDLTGKAKRIAGVNLENDRNFLEDLLLSVPLMTKDGNIYKFMHRTIAEFFCAEFIVRHEKSFDILIKIISLPEINNFKKPIDFIFEISEPLYKRAIIKNIAKDFISFSKTTKRNKFYKTEKFLFETEFYIHGQDIAPEEVKNSGKMRIFLPITLHGNKVIHTLELMYSSKYYFPKGATEKLVETETNEANSKDFDFSIIGKLVSKYLKANKWYSTSSKEIISLYNDKDFQKISSIFLLVRDIELHGSYKTPSFISLDKCKNLIDEIDEFEQYNSELSLLLPTK